jgi:hypothetical protein
VSPGRNEINERDQRGRKILHFRSSDFQMEILISIDSRVKSAAVAQRIRLLSISRLALSIVTRVLARWCTATNLSQTPKFYG